MQLVKRLQSITLALLAAFGASTSAVAKVHVPEKLASGVFAVNYDPNAPVDEAGALDYAGRASRCSYELVSGQSKWLSRDPLGDMAFRQMQMQAHGSTAFGDLIASKLTANEREQLESPYGEGIDWASAFIPSVESGLYRFAGNNPISMIDILGLLEYWELEGNYPTPTNYPTDPLSSNSIWKLIGGKVQQNGESGTFRNSCAIRMSHALNASGVLISSASGPVSSGMNPPKWWYIYRVENLKTFLRQKFGAPETFTPADFKKNCKKGIVIFNMTGDGFTGHADLWDGSTTIDGHDEYIDASSSVLFWEVQGN